MNNEIMQKLRRIWPKGALDKSGESNFCEMMRRVDPRLQRIRCLTPVIESKEATGPGCIQPKDGKDIIILSP